MRHILIGGAWPYAAGPLHIGHIASLLPGDVLARYFRAAGDWVIYVSGTDCHGTAVTLRARHEARTSREVSDDFHQAFDSTFRALGFSFDLYSKTSHPQHIRYVQDFHKKLYDSEFVYERETAALRCSNCEAFLSDREVKGFCPSCGAPATGEQCPACGRILEAEALINPVCAACGTAVEKTCSPQLFLNMHRLTPRLRAWHEAHPPRRRSVQELTARLLDDSPADCALTRQLDWGIPVPREGFDDRRIFVWAENVLGYYSAARKVCDAYLWDPDDFFTPDARHYLVHGRANVPYHTLLLPALLLAQDDNAHLPDVIAASAHMLYDGKTVSGRDGDPAVTADALLADFPADVIRYYFLSCGVEKKDTLFSRAELAADGRELADVYGNFVHRTLAFISRYFGGEMPFADIEPALEKRVADTYAAVAGKLEEARVRSALEDVMNLARLANRYFDARQPWKTRLSHPGQCLSTLAGCLWLCANLCVLFSPFLPDSSRRLADTLGISSISWHLQPLPTGTIRDCEPLFPRSAE
ncbi:MAG: methionine--tRNA ligase [Clostridia bacterium]|nr:methionine--tRNA ligase [Clostridia bacterium]